MELMTNIGFHRVMLKGSHRKKNGCGKLYMYEMGELLIRKVKCFGEDDIILRLERGEALSESASTGKATEYIRTCYEKLKNMFLKFRDS